MSYQSELSAILAGGTITRAQIEGLVDRQIARIPSELAGTKGVILYSGLLGNGGFHSAAAADALYEAARANGTRLATIDRTAVGGLLSDPNFRKAINQAGYSATEVAQLLGGKDPSGISYNGTWWEDASRALAKNASGNAIIIGPNAQPEKVFGQVELPELLKNTKINQINGLGRQVFLDEAANLARAGSSTEAIRNRMFDIAKGQSLANHLASPELKFGLVKAAAPGGYDKYAANSFSDFFARNGLNVGDRFNLNVDKWRYVNDLAGGYGADVLGSLARVSDFLKPYAAAAGPVGDILDGSLSAYNAWNKVQAGDTTGAFAELSGFAGSLAGGTLGGSAGMALAAALGFSGPAGWALAAALAIGGGLGGEAFGRWGAEGLANLFNGAGDWLNDAADGFADALSDQLRRLIDPIVLDLDGNGIALMARMTSNLYFDMDGDGIKEQTGWVTATDGLLAIDSNQNGKIDNINELIGDLGRSGFAELLTYDLNKDLIINANDAVWTQFRVWMDANSNAVTDAGELRTLSSLNIRSIDLRYTGVNFTAEGNRIHEQSIFEFTNGRTGLIADIWFDVSNVSTDSSIALTGNLTVDNLPDIRGRGDVASLRTAMLADGALATMVAGFISQDINSLVNVRNQTEQIIYRWAGVQSVDPSSRGELFDGRKLAALEAFLGTPFNVRGVSDPTIQAVASLSTAWNNLVNGILSRLLMASPLGNLISDSCAYLPTADRLITNKKPADLLDNFKSNPATREGTSTAGYWAAALLLIGEIRKDIGADPNEASFQAAVVSALQGTGLEPFADLLSSGVLPLDPLPSMLLGPGVFQLSSGNDALWLDQERHAVYAGDGDDFLAVLSAWSQSQLINGGAGNDQLFGGSANDWIDGAAGVDTMAGAGGDDTYTVDDVADVVIESAGGGEDHVRSSITYTLANSLEHLTLLGSLPIHGIGTAAANRISGNSAANRLEGLAGHDTLDGGAGADTMRGGSGMDFYRVDSVGDTIIETGSDSDTIEASVNYTLGARLETLRLVGSALNATGNDDNNTLWGNPLNNVLNGAGGLDRMIGGAGNDTYIVDHSNDSAEEDQAAGIDRVQSSVSYTLGWNLEHLTLSGAQNISATGNDLANQINGNSGDNWIDGREAADTMSGGNGDDTYSIDHADDVVIEAFNAGNDWLYSAQPAYALPANTEHLRLYLGWDDGGNRNGSGNGLDNEIIGTSGSNALTGLAGNDSLEGQAGNDTLLGGDGDDLLDGGSEQDRLLGGTGNDRYILDQINDSVVEAFNAGIDTIETSLACILPSNVENLILTGDWNAVDGQGNGLNNQLTGNNANNNLDGAAGADTMAGAGGDDTYTVDDVADVIFELPASGTDQVRAATNYALGVFIENLTLLGSSDINGAGNAMANNISGNAGANILTGGPGNDILKGDAGADTFRYLNIDDSGNRESAADLVTDFSRLQSDLIDLSAIDAIAATPGNEAFVFIGAAAFTSAGQARSFVWGDTTYLTLNADSDTNDAEMMILLAGAQTLRASSIIL